MHGNERKQRLLNLLEGTLSVAPVPVDKLAEILQVSPRTIRYDLDRLQTELYHNGWLIHRKTGCGIWLEKSGALTKEEINTNYILDPKERRDQIIIALLDEDISSIDELANLLRVSRSTLLGDLKAVQELLERRNLSYGSKRGHGIWAKGTEIDIRDTLIHVFARHMYDFRHFESPAEPIHSKEASFRKYAVNLPVQDIATVFLQFMKDSELDGNDASVNRMIVALVVQLKRLKERRYIHRGRRVDFLSDEGLYLERAATALAKGMEQFSKAFRRKNEVQALMKELMHSRIYKVHSSKGSRQETDANALRIARRFIAVVQIWLGDDYGDDEELLYNIAMHLLPAIERVRCGIVYTNPLLAQIRQQYSELFQIACKASERITEGSGIQLSDDEIGYLTVHLGAAVERRKLYSHRKLTVLLVCGNGIGMANLLEMTLKSHMPFIHIVRKISFYQLRREDMADVDLVLTTVALDVLDKAVLRVSPILSDAEIRVVEKQIRYVYNKKYVAEVGAEENHLWQLLTPEVIELNGVTRDWEEAVRMAGKLLTQVGAVRETYIDGMVECIRSLGPYSVICPGVAMPHARPEDGANRVAVSFLRLKQPVLFGDGENTMPVNMLFAFSAIDTTQHISLLEDLWRVFMSKEALYEFQHVQTSQELRLFLQTFLRG